MTEVRIEELLFAINGTLGKIETKLVSVCEILAQHEHRITKIESDNKTVNNTQEDWKTQLLMIMGKSIIIGLTVIGSLVGGTSLISQIVSQSTYTSTITTHE